CSLANGSHRFELSSTEAQSTTVFPSIPCHLSRQFGAEVPPASFAALEKNSPVGISRQDCPVNVQSQVKTVTVQNSLMVAAIYSRNLLS
ncbi:MAG: hypothetical protein ACKO7W_16165, partial [Elainella sp.]